MTKTYYHSSITTSTSTHAVESGLTLDTAPSGSPTSFFASINGGSSKIPFTLITPPGEPGTAIWPTATGAARYRCILTIPSNGADISFGLLALGTETGHFARVNSGLTSDLSTATQDEAAFTGTGVFVASTSTWNPGSASDTDRFECLLAITRPNNHGNQTLELATNVSSAGEVNGGISDGPWTVSGSTNVTPTDLTVTGTAQNASISTSKSSTPGSVDCVVAAQNATVTAEKQANAGEAPASGLVPDSNRQTASGVQAVSATGSAQPAVLAVDGSPLHAPVGSTALDATVQTSGGGSASAIEAAIGSVSESPSRLVSVKAKTA